MTKLIKINYPNIDEDLYYVKLENGLTVYFIKKIGFLEKTAMLTVGFGSLDNKLTVDDGSRDAPAGIAHFLEHKLFEDESGGDISLKFTQLGAETNAFTTFNQTSFFFSTASKFQENLELLQYFVLSANITDESVSREKKIIGQEIDMYQDDADYRAYSGILRNLFPKTSLANDIAGSKESIQKITKILLETHHTYFYQPTNMSLFIVGDIDIDETFLAIQRFQTTLSYPDRKRVTVDPLHYYPVIKSSSVDMDVTTAKLVVGFRGYLTLTQHSLLTYRIALKLFLSMLIGWTSKIYHTLYEDGKIDDSFDVDVEIHHNFQFVLISLDTPEPIAMSNYIRQKLATIKISKEFTNEHLNLLKKEMYGDFIQSLDSIEHLTHQFSLYLSDSDKETYFDIPKIIERLTLKDVVTIGKAFFEKADASDFTVFPK
ncbi:TPA: M16 family metallopeptidase [Streptococcus pyogenes]|uniref:EF-P 5-aminopentanol modification-associated protein YfmH n=1 Tax=Streptococcus pyogenes TaxID=1314 RepID=UPI0010120B23|nr:pitrilysin family protein [Streptococcus pyogenes]HER4556429.1 insulinase family protein [Streptococcus pyogenes NGAS717]HER4691808.1 insulinase family protein [Streptococcus pyogenes NGAS372]QAX75270.1 insulinase family protein [Streptococcus pyogenes]UQB40397.1 insulinase family protein [Streptococcus pyogenes]VGR35218.1 insulinase family protein [Streptococcus pyogenes]